MKSIKELVENFLAGLGQLRVRAHKALGGLGDLEKIEASQPVVNALRELDWIGQRLEEIGAAAEPAVKSLDEALAELAAAAVTEAVTGGAVVKREDHEAQLAAARQAGVEAAHAAFEAERQKDAKAEELRAGLAVEIGAGAAAAISRDELVGEDAQHRIDILKARAARLAEVGISAEAHGPAYADLLACPLDEAGTAQFEARVKGYEAVMAAAAPPAGGNLPPKPDGTAMHAGTGGPPERKQPVI
jgi:hypothetical protein